MAYLRLVGKEHLLRAEGALRLGFRLLLFLLVRATGFMTAVPRWFLSLDIHS